MKKVCVIVVLLTLLASCATPLKNLKETYIIDYSRYDKVGFFLTESSSVSFDYKPIGSTLSIVAGEKALKGKSKNIFGTNVVYFNVYDALDEIVRGARAKGADGVIGLRINTIYDKEYGIGYEVYGMAIKRSISSPSSNFDF